MVASGSPRSGQRFLTSPSKPTSLCFVTGALPRTTSSSVTASCGLLSLVRSSSSRRGGASDLVAGNVREVEGDPLATRDARQLSHAMPGTSCVGATSRRQRPRRPTGTRSTFRSRTRSPCRRRTHAPWRSRTRSDALAEGERRPRTHGARSTRTPASQAPPRSPGRGASARSSPHHRERADVVPVLGRGIVGPVLGLERVGRHRSCPRDRPPALPSCERNSSAPFVIIVPARAKRFSTTSSSASSTEPISARLACTSAASPNRCTSAYRNSTIGSAAEYGTITTPRT